MSWLASLLTGTASFRLARRTSRTTYLCQSGERTVPKGITTWLVGGILFGLVGSFWLGWVFLLAISESLVASAVLLAGDPFILGAAMVFASPSSSMTGGGDGRRLDTIAMQAPPTLTS